MTNPFCPSSLHFLFVISADEAFNGEDPLIKLVVMLYMCTQAYTLAQDLHIDALLRKFYNKSKNFDI